MRTRLKSFIEATFLTNCLLFLVLGVSLDGLIVSHQTNELVAELVMLQEKPMTYTIHWPSGTSTVITTERRLNETIEDLTARHYAEIQYVLDHPPPGSGA